MTKLTRIDADHGRVIACKGGEPVADITPDAEGRGLWVHYFGPTSCSIGWPHLVRTFDDAREVIRMAAAA